jgi:uncharacterized protein YdeI (BOF family)
MAAALNNFRTTLVDLTTTTANVYTPPLGYATVVLMAQVSNTGANTIQISSGIYRGSASTSLINNASVPEDDAISVLTGRLILQYGDILQFTSSDDTSAQLVLSYLETLVIGN